MPEHVATAGAQPGPQASSAKKGWWQRLGPGLITGAADDDPSGIATYSQAGAQFGLGTLWSLLFTFPLMVGIQLVSAGRVSGHGLATNLCQHYPRPLLWVAVALLLVANVANIAADLAAMGEVARLVAGGPVRMWTVGFGLLALLLQVFVPYTRYVRILKWLTLVLFAYVAVLFALQVPWGEVMRATFWPPLSLKADYITTIVAILGTTISPYLFFWQASQEVEEMQGRNPPAKPLKDDPARARGSNLRSALDTCVGMAVSNGIAFCIMLTAALALHAHGHTEIRSAADAAQALKPVAGELAFAVFVLGIIGTGMLAIPVLAGSVAYALAGTCGWQNSLELHPGKARAFYGTIAAAMVLGIAVSFTPLDPMRALFWAAVLNGVVAVPIMALMMRMAADPRVMGQFTASLLLRTLGWVPTGLMALAVVLMVVL